MFIDAKVERIQEPEYRSKKIKVESLRR